MKQLTVEKIENRAKDIIAARSKDQIYLATKVFIAEVWRSAQDVIQLDDKEEGIIILKGNSIMRPKYMGQVYVFVYRYMITFQMKENKYRMILQDVYCESAKMANGHFATMIQPFEGDNCPPTGTFGATGLPKNKAILMMAELKQDLQSAMDSYKILMAKAEVDNEW